MVGVLGLGAGKILKGCIKLQGSLIAQAKLRHGMEGIEKSAHATNAHQAARMARYLEGAL